MHKFAVYAAESWDPIDDVAPKVKIIALFDDAVILSDSQFGAPVDRCAWKSSKHHHHFPIKEDCILFFNDREDIHIELFAAAAQPVA